MSAAQNTVTQNWAINLQNTATVVEGVQATRQRWWLAINTPLGDDAGRPLYGTNLISWIDKPALLAAANITNEFFNAATWVPEISIKKIKYTIGTGTLTFVITYTINNTLLNDIVSITSSGITFTALEKLIAASSDIPVPQTDPNSAPVFSEVFADTFQQNNNNQTIAFTVNGLPAVPTAPVDGFANMWDLYAWVKQNWGNYGVWGLGKDILVCYLNTNYNNCSLNLGIAS